LSIFFYEVFNIHTTKWVAPKYIALESAVRDGIHPQKIQSRAIESLVKKPRRCVGITAELVDIARNDDIDDFDDVDDIDDVDDVDFFCGWNYERN